MNDASASLETLVGAVDELDASDVENLPDEVASILNYINTHCRHVVSGAAQ